MRRRLVLLAGALALGGCGFQLRRAPSFVFQSVYVGAGENSPVATELRRSLASNGALQVLDRSVPADRAQVILDLLSEQREKVVVGLGASGQVREFQLRVRVKFKLRTPQGKELIPETELLQQREISFSESVALAKEAEEALLYRDMQSDVVQQLMRRLEAVKTL